MLGIIRGSCAPIWRCRCWKIRNLGIEAAFVERADIDRHQSDGVTPEGETARVKHDSFRKKFHKEVMHPG